MIWSGCMIYPPERSALPPGHLWHQPFVSWCPGYGLICRRDSRFPPCHVEICLLRSTRVCLGIVEWLLCVLSGFLLISSSCRWDEFLFRCDAPIWTAWRCDDSSAMMSSSLISILGVESNHFVKFSSLYINLWECTDSSTGHLSWIESCQTCVNLHHSYRQSMMMSHKFQSSVNEWQIARAHRATIIYICVWVHRFELYIFFLQRSEMIRTCTSSDNHMPFVATESWTPTFIALLQHFWRLGTFPRQSALFLSIIQLSATHSPKNFLHSNSGPHIQCYHTTWAADSFLRSSNP